MKIKIELEIDEYELISIDECKQKAAWQYISQLVEQCGSIRLASKLLKMKTRSSIQRILKRK